VDRIASSAAPDFVMLLPILGRLFEFPGNTQKLHSHQYTFPKIIGETISCSQGLLVCSPFFM
jgi:hypothetical protein